MTAGLLLGACGPLPRTTRTGPPAAAAGTKPVVVQVTRPIGDAAEGAGVRLAQREVAWAREVLAERAPFALERDGDPDAPGAPTPGLHRAAELLRARGEVVQKLRARIDQLPAADAIPGVAPARTVMDFRQREPSVAEAIRNTLARELQERLLTGSREGEGTLEGRVALAPIARAVWEAGGGRRLDERTLETRARDGAMEEARMKLREALREATFPDGVPVSQWLLEGGDRVLRLESVASRARERRSEPVTVDGRRLWIVELEVSPELLDEMRFPLPPPAAPASPVAPTPTPAPPRRR